MFFVANWKMRGGIEQVRDYIIAMGSPKALKLSNEHTLIICPPYPYIEQLATAGLNIGSQDCSAHDAGSYTGEVSASMLADIGCKYVIIGHSERRKNFDEQLEIIAMKLERALSAGLQPILCIGELTRGLEPEVALNMIIGELQQISILGLKSTGLLAYEPVWAIGTGLVPEQEYIAYIAQGLSNYTGSSWPVLYGGSVDVRNVSNLRYTPGLSGFLVGGASLPASNLLELMHLCS